MYLGILLGTTDSHFFLPLMKRKMTPLGGGELASQLILRDAGLHLTVRNPPIVQAEPYLGIWIGELESPLDPSPGSGMAI